MKPFLKWPGGKTTLLPKILDSLPKDIDNRKQYVEPFLGAGSIFLAMLERNFNSYLVNDVNLRLINVYETIRDNPQQLMGWLDIWEKEYRDSSWDERKIKYNEYRNEFNSEQKGIHNAALFIYLNKTCFNGLYRENSKGGFNSPIGKYENPNFYEKDNIISLSKLLNQKKVNFMSEDFKQLEKNIGSDAFVYLDPPYHPINGVGYTTYKLDSFNETSQLELKEMCDRMDSNGVNWLLSNSDPKNTDPKNDFLDNLYSAYNIERVQVGRSIGANSSSRKKVNELLIRNY